MYHHSCVKGTGTSSACLRQPAFGRAAPEFRGKSCVCLALKDKVPTAQQTVARRVQVSQQEDFANTPARRYVFFTGFPFPLGPLLYRKTVCREVRPALCRGAAALHTVYAYHQCRGTGCGHHCCSPPLQQTQRISTAARTLVAHLSSKRHTCMNAPHNLPPRRPLRNTLTTITALPFKQQDEGSSSPCARVQLVQDTMWSFEQPQSLAFSSVHVNVRMTVTRLASGGLLVYNPIAPTQECLAQLGALNAPVEYILLGSAAYEHKVFVGPFSRKFPKADVYVAPQQYSWPLPLPLPLLGIFAKGTLAHDDKSTPWAQDFEQKVLAAPRFAVAGLYTEVALFHKASRTLLVTDAVVQIPTKPPPCIAGGAARAAPQALQSRMCTCCWQAVTSARGRKRACARELPAELLLGACTWGTAAAPLRPSSLPPPSAHALDNDTDPCRYAPCQRAQRLCHQDRRPHLRRRQRGQDLWRRARARHAGEPLARLAAHLPACVLLRAVGAV